MYRHKKAKDIDKRLAIMIDCPRAISFLNQKSVIKPMPVVTMSAVIRFKKSIYTAET